MDSDCRNREEDFREPLRQSHYEYECPFGANERLYVRDTDTIIPFQLHRLFRWKLHFIESFSIKSKTGKLVFDIGLAW